ncbi:hypothetical protein Lfu02_05090 [Longispora fulva]|nr:hypothetical protein Lfu02_05090 [Longispora fulva]
MPTTMPRIFETYRNRPASNAANARAPDNTESRASSHIDVTPPVGTVHTGRNLYAAGKCQRRVRFRPAPGD